MVLGKENSRIISAIVKKKIFTCAEIEGRGQSSKLRRGERIFSRTRQKLRIAPKSSPFLSFAPTS